ncbi:MAG: cyclophilin-like fold protein [Campylobacteraceae bacterium]
MKKYVFTLLITIFILLNQASGEDMKIKISIGEQSFFATLNNSSTAKEFFDLLPMTINMDEHGGFEKNYRLGKRLSGSSLSPDIIREGDLMIWSQSVLVLFYKEHSTFYSYIPLGRIDDTKRLEKALGRSSIKVKFELIQ